MANYGTMFFLLWAPVPWRRRGSRVGVRPAVVGRLWRSPIICLIVRVDFFYYYFIVPPLFSSTLYHPSLCVICDLYTTGTRLYSNFGFKQRTAKSKGPLFPILITATTSCSSFFHTVRQHLAVSVCNCILKECTCFKCIISL